ncbi:transposase [Streptomyces sp. NPDC053069]|uniref:transposase n=1 Tax=Streptomyces sp. NPDC053069 TaxID=3365695 RepID=UPI0037D2ACB3
MLQDSTHRVDPVTPFMAIMDSRQIEGRNAAAVAAWLTAQPTWWTTSIRYVAIDLCATFPSAVRTALPHATGGRGRLPIRRLPFPGRTFAGR